GCGTGRRTTSRAHKRRENRPPARGRAGNRGGIHARRQCRRLRTAPTTPTPRPTPTLACATWRFLLGRRAFFSSLATPRGAPREKRTPGMLLAQHSQRPNKLVVLKAPNGAARRSARAL